MSLQYLRRPLIPCALFGFFCCALGESSLHADSLSFEKVIHGSYTAAGSPAENGKKPKVKEPNTSGGEAEVTLVFNYFIDTSATFTFDWQFSEDIASLKVGDTVTVTYSVAVKGDPGASGYARIIPLHGMGLSTEFKDFKSVANLTQVQGLSVPKRQWASSAPSGKHTQTAELKVVPFGATTEYAALKLNMESGGPLGSDRLHYEVVYLFKTQKEKTGN